MMDYNEQKQAMEHLYYGIDMALKYKGKTYFIEGAQDDSESRLWVDVYASSDDNRPDVINFSGKSKEMVRRSFLHAQIFDGKTFEQVVSDVEWDDEFY